MITLESLISTVCLDVVNVLLMDYLVSSFYEFKWTNKYLYLFITTSIYLICHFIFFDNQYTLYLDILILLFFLVNYRIKKKSFFKIMILGIVVYFFSVCIFYFFYKLIFNRNIVIREITENNLTTIFIMIGPKYILYVIFQYFLFQRKKLNQIKIKIFKYISFGVSVFYGVCIFSTFDELLFYHDEVGRIFIFTLVLYNTVLVIFNYYQNMHIRTVNKLETLKQNRSYQGKYWKDYYENYAAIRKTKHDMLNGYIGLYGLVKEERYDELKLYLESSIKNLKEMESVHYFGNPLIDAIVSKKISDAKERGIEVVFHCGVISIGDIDEEDLGILLANALDNAIESTVKSSYDKIDVYVSTMNCFLKIDVINYVDDITGVSFKNTSKVFDKENHGIGLKSMKDTAKKYNGSLQYDKKDNEVILSVIMNIN